jgi:hypothetical protein
VSTALTFMICYRNGGTWQECLAAVGQSVPEAAFLAAVAATGPLGELAVAAAGAAPALGERSGGAETAEAALTDAQAAHWQNTDQFRYEMNMLSAQVTQFEEEAAAATGGLCSQITKAAEAARKSARDAGSALSTLQQQKSCQALDAPKGLAKTIATDATAGHQSADDAQTDIAALRVAIEKLAAERKSELTHIVNWAGAFAPVLGRDSCNLRDPHQRIMDSLYTWWNGRLTVAAQACLAQVDDLLTGARDAARNAAQTDDQAKTILAKLSDGSACQSAASTCNQPSPGPPLCPPGNIIYVCESDRGEEWAKPPLCDIDNVGLEQIKAFCPNPRVVTAAEAATLDDEYNKHMGLADAAAQLQAQASSGTQCHPEQKTPLQDVMLQRPEYGAASPAQPAPQLPPEYGAATPSTPTQHAPTPGPQANFEPPSLTPSETPAPTHTPVLPSPEPGPTVNGGEPSQPTPVHNPTPPSLGPTANGGTPGEPMPSHNPPPGPTIHNKPIIDTWTPPKQPSNNGGARVNSGYGLPGGIECTGEVGHAVCTQGGHPLNCTSDGTCTDSAGRIVNPQPPLKQPPPPTIATPPKSQPSPSRVAPAEPNPLPPPTIATPPKPQASPTQVARAEPNPLPPPTIAMPPKPLPGQTVAKAEPKSLPPPVIAAEPKALPAAPAVPPPKPTPAAPPPPPKPANAGPAPPPPPPLPQQQARVEPPSVAPECRKKSVVYHPDQNDSHTVPVTIIGGAPCPHTYAPLPGNDLQLTEAAVVSAPHQGKVQRGGPLTLDYRPNPGAIGSDRYEVKVCGTSPKGSGCSHLTYEIMLQ